MSQNQFTPITTVTANYTVLLTDHEIRCNSASDITLTLGDLTDFALQNLNVSNINTGIVSFSENIDGVTVTLSQNQSIQIHASDTAWSSMKKSISHDRQFIIDQTPQSTSSGTFVDITNATLTTKDLGETGNYTVSFGFLVSPSVALTVASFRLLKNGSPLGISSLMVSLKTLGQDIGVPFKADATGIVDGDVLQVQWFTDKGSITLAQFDFSMDGIPETRVLT